MLTRPELARLEWHPLRNVGPRTENYALASEPAAGVQHYRMACGHRSLPRLTVCERGCKEAPPWPQPLLRSGPLEALDKFGRRYDPSRESNARLRELRARARHYGAERGYRFVPRQVA